MQKKPNYELKAEVLRQGLDKYQRQISKKAYLGDESAILLNFYMMENDPLYKEAYKINHASYERTKRLRKRIASYLLSGHKCIFVTLTFTNEVLKSTTEETRRTYVRRFLKSQSDKYVANIDFGKDYGREHYHSVIVCDNLELKSWLYGSINVERIKVSQSSEIKIPKYINKLTNHAIKETVKRNYCIYSKN